MAAPADAGGCARAQHFINDYEKNKSFSGFPALGIDWQKMESPFLRKSLGMKARPLEWASPVSPAGLGVLHGKAACPSVLRGP